MHSPSSPVLCYVRGFGDHYDAQNIAHALVLDNICTVTGLAPEDIFILPTTIQALPNNKIDNKKVLVEENVLSVMYNPETIDPSQLLESLRLLGLVDSSQTVQLTIRGIPLEYIAHPDVIL